MNKLIALFVKETTKLSASSTQIHLMASHSIVSVVVNIVL